METAFTHAFAMTISQRSLRILSAFTLGCAGLSTSHALELASFKIVAQGGGVGSVDGARISIVNELRGPGAPDPAYLLFNEVMLTPADLGSTFTLTSSDADFVVFEQMLTNGINDNFGFLVDFLPEAGGMGIGWNELNLFTSGTQPLGIGWITSIGQLAGPDFAGYDIAQVTLTIDKFDLTNTGSNYSHDLQATARIIAVPEPCSTSLFLAGAIALIRRRRTRRQ